CRCSPSFARQTCLRSPFQASDLVFYPFMVSTRDPSSRPRDALPTRLVEGARQFAKATRKMDAVNAGTTLSDPSAPRPAVDHPDQHPNILWLDRPITRWH